MGKLNDEIAKLSKIDFFQHAKKESCANSYKVARAWSPRFRQNWRFFQAKRVIKRSVVELGMPLLQLSAPFVTYVQENGQKLKVIFDKWYNACFFSDAPIKTPDAQKLLTRL